MNDVQNLTGESLTDATPIDNKPTDAQSHDRWFRTKVQEALDKIENGTAVFREHDDVWDDIEMMAHHMMQMEKALHTVDAAKAALDAMRPLPMATVASLREALALEWTYHSNAIEGNTLTLNETKVVLEGITVGGRSMREHLEAINHRDAIEHIETLVSEPAALSQAQVKAIHGLVLRSIRTKDAGRYRRQNVVIAGASTRPPDFLHLDEEMTHLLEWHERDAQAKHPIALAAEFHARFETIHPFIDGNGRTGRLLMNLQLMKAGYPPAVIRREDRVAYYDALDEMRVTGSVDRLTTLVAEAAQRSLDAYLGLIAQATGYNVE